MLYKIISRTGIAGSWGQKLVWGVTSEDDEWADSSLCTSLEVRCGRRTPVMWLPWKRRIELAACLAYLLSQRMWKKIWIYDFVHQGVLTGRNCIIIYILHFITWQSKGEGIHSVSSSVFFICMTLTLQGDICSHISLRVVGFKMSDSKRETLVTWSM